MILSWTPSSFGYIPRQRAAVVARSRCEKSISIPHTASFRSQTRAPRLHRSDTTPGRTLARPIRRNHALPAPYRHTDRLHSPRGPPTGVLDLETTTRLVGPRCSHAHHARLALHARRRGDRRETGRTRPGRRQRPASTSNARRASVRAPTLTIASVCVRHSGSGRTSPGPLRGAHAPWPSAIHPRLDTGEHPHGSADPLSP